MKSKFAGFSTLKRTVSMVQVLNRYGLMDQMRRRGDSLSGACPIHGGHNSTQFRVSISKNSWICFGDCQRGGSIIDFVSRKEGIGIREAAVQIQEWFATDRNKPSESKMLGQNPSDSTGPANHERSRHHTPEKRNQPLGFVLRNLDPKHSYLKERGLTEETIATFGLGYCPKGILAGRIAIPIHNARGQLVAYAGRWPGQPPEGCPRYTLPRGFRKSCEIFNIHRAMQTQGQGPWIMVEGYFGCMKVWQAGFHRVVALMGCMLSEHQAELMIQTVGARGRVLLLFDEDQAGQLARIKVRERLARSLKVKGVLLPEPGLQPDALSPEQLRELLSS